MQWQKDLGGLYNEQVFSIVQTPDRGFVISGTTSSSDGDATCSHGTNDFLLVKLNSAGTYQWSKCYGGTSFDNGSSVINTSDGGFAFIGAGGSQDGDMDNLHGGNDFWLIKIFSNGNIDWQKVFGGTSGDYGYSLVQSDDGG